jgi:uncharacterized protein YidB (DUF937 family)
MGLLGSLAEKLVSNAIGGNAAAQQQNAVSGALALLNHPSVGGVAGLAQLFENNGLGHIMSGWVSNGPNPAVSGSQLQQVLGSAPIAEFAQKLGIPPEQAASHLAEILPHLINHLTPNGTIPQGTGLNLQTVEAELKSKLFG